MADYMLAHDLGTTGDKATLFGVDGRLIGSAFAAYETDYPQAGWAEQQAEDYWQAFCIATRELFDKTGIAPGEIAVISFSGQMMAALAVDDRGTPLRPSIIWADMRATDQADAILEKIDAQTCYEITGHRLSPSYSAPKIMWLREHEPDTYAKAYKFIHAKDYLALKLTGRFVSDYTDGSGMNLLDIRGLTWSDELLALTSIDRDKLPELVESTEVIGKVQREAAQQSGLLEGTPVVIGGGDGACATCGAGVVREGDAYIYLGTSTWMGLATRQPLIDPQRRTFTFCHFNKGLYMPCGTMQAGGGSLKWFKEVLCGEESAAADAAGRDVYDLLNEQAAAIEPGAGGLLFLPHLIGERSPVWNPRARGCFIGLTMVHDKRYMLRAVMEGVACHMKHIEEAFVEQGVKQPVIRMIGGGAKSALWRSIFADVMEKDIALLNFIEEATSIGAAIAGGVGAGLFESIEAADRFIKVAETTRPCKDHYAAYRKLYPLFKKSYAQLESIFEALA